MIAREQEEIRKYLEARAAMQALAARIRCWEEVPPATALPIERVTWCVEEMIPAGGVTLFAGESGSYKTWLALLLARGVSRGEHFLGRRCAQRDVLYLDRENPAAILRERMSLLGMLPVAPPLSADDSAGADRCVRPMHPAFVPHDEGAHPGAPLRNEVVAHVPPSDVREADVRFLPHPASGQSARDRRTGPELQDISTENFRLWGAWLEDAPPGIGDARLMEMARERRPLMIFDSLIRFHQQDENSATAMAQVMAELRALANAGATVVALHHKPKGEQSQYRGSSDIRAGVDVAFAIAQDRTAGLVKFACFKNRLAAEFALTLRPEITDGGDFAVVDGVKMKQEEDVAVLRRLIELDSGLSQRQIVENCGLPQKRAIQVLHQYEGKLWRAKKGSKGALRYVPLKEGDDSEE